MGDVWRNGEKNNRNWRETEYGSMCEREKISLLLYNGLK